RARAVQHRAHPFEAARDHGRVVDRERAVLEAELCGQRGHRTRAASREHGPLPERARAPRDQLARVAVRAVEEPCAAHVASILRGRRPWRAPRAAAAGNNILRANDLEPPRVVVPTLRCNPLRFRYLRARAIMGSVMVARSISTATISFGLV